MESNLEPRCKLCLLLKESEDLWVEVHNKVIKEKLAQSLVCQWLNSRVDVLNADIRRETKIKPFNSANFSVHFRDHVKGVSDMVAQLDEALLCKNTTFSEAQQTKAVIVRSWEAEGEYARLSQMLHFMDDNLMAYEKTLEKKRNEGKDATVKEIQNYSDLVYSFVETKRELTKLKTLEKSMSLALATAVDEILRGLADKSAQIAEDVKDFIAVESPPGSTLPDAVLKMLKFRLSSDLNELGANTLAKVKREHGIR